MNQTSHVGCIKADAIATIPVGSTKSMDSIMALAHWMFPSSVPVFWHFTTAPDIAVGSKS